MNKKLIATLTLSAVAASAFAMGAGAATDKQVSKDEKGVVHNVIGQLGQVSGTTAEEIALNALHTVKGDFGFDQAQGKFKLKSSHKDENGVTHTKLTQQINGINVYGAEMIVHEEGGNVYGVTGSYQALTADAAKGSVKEKDALGLALAHTGYTGELNGEAETELLYFPVGNAAKLAYKVNVSYLSDDPALWTIFVSAVDGSILDAHDELAHANKPSAKPGGTTGGTSAVGSGVGVLGDNKTINTTLRSGLYYLEDRTKQMFAQGGLVKTQNYNNGTRLSDFTDADNKWDASTHRAGVDAHFYAAKTYDWFLNSVGRNSIDDRGMTLLSGVHYGTNYNNAFWDGTKMTYGDGDGVNFIAFSGSLDVIAHELTHGVTDYTSGLVYRDQSGALNESWSDALAAVVEGRNWDIGEDVYTPNKANDALRSMSDPNLYGDPAHMSQYVYTSSDNGGVHTNSGIPNKAFYNFATDIGSREIAGKVWYVATRDYMTSSTNFSGARAATIQAANALYGAGSSTATAVANAWSAVGVY